MFLLCRAAGHAGDDINDGDSHDEEGSGDDDEHDDAGAVRGLAPRRQVAGAARRSTHSKKHMKNAYVKLGAAAVAKKVFKSYRAGGLQVSKKPSNDYDRRIIDRNNTEDPLFHLTPLGAQLLQDIAASYSKSPSLLSALVEKIPELAGADYEKYTPKSKERREYMKFQLDKVRGLTNNSLCEAHRKPWESIDNLRQARFQGEATCAHLHNLICVCCCNLDACFRSVHCFQFSQQIDMFVVRFLALFRDLP